MPSTSRNPGYGVRPSNGSVNDTVRVGQDYLKALHGKYGGDLALTWGAYNAGPGRIDSLVSRYGNDWLSHAPQETQNYVRKNLTALRNM